MGSFQVPMPERTGRATLLVSVGLLTGLAWVALVVFEEATHSVVHLGGGHYPGHHGEASGGGYALLFLAGWTLMCVAMMLPTSLPVLAAFHTLARGRPDARALVALVIAGYLTTWVGFGLLVYGQHLVFQRLLTASGWTWAGALGAPALLVLAGAFQFSSLKYRCLDKCRSPLAFVLGYWQGRRERWQALRLGLDHGAFCVGCCWALMLLMFLVGVHYLAWMLILGIVMAVEKNVSWGRRLSAPLGIVLIAVGVAAGVVVGLAG
jgi:predicted metal-binding membrane protein